MRLLHDCDGHHSIAFLEEQDPQDGSEAMTNCVASRLAGNASEHFFHMIAFSRADGQVGDTRE